MEFVITYGAPVWCGILRYRRYRNLLLDMKKKMLLRMAVAYRTVSSEALQVITGIIPIDLQLIEKKKMYDGKMGEHERKLARAGTIERWQKRWAKNNDVE